MNYISRATLVLLANLILSQFACSHSGSTSFIELELNDSEAAGAWWLSLKDLQVAVGLDANLDDQITVAEFKQQQSQILIFAQNTISLLADNQACPIKWGLPSLSRLDDGVYVQLPMLVQCGTGLSLNQIHYSALFDLDNSHRVIVNLKQAEQSRVLMGSPNRQQLAWDFNSASAWQNIVTYVEQGIIHILEGYDHLLFLMALLVPIVFANKPRINVATESKNAYRDMAVSLLKVVTAFTLGHSITLILATVFSISPPSSWVESFIAISVVIAGINIVLPLFRESSWRVAALFGLIHGFGFASVLAELSLDRSALALSLLSFNIGVELGQLFVVLLATPVLIFFARRSSFMPMLARYSAASIAAVIGSLWVVDRIPL